MESLVRLPRGRGSWYQTYPAGVWLLLSGASRLRITWSDDRRLRHNGFGRLDCGAEPFAGLLVECHPRSRANRELGVCRQHVNSRDTHAPCFSRRPSDDVVGSPLADIGGRCGPVYFQDKKAWPVRRCCLNGVVDALGFASHVVTSLGLVAADCLGLICTAVDTKTAKSSWMDNGCNNRPHGNRVLDLTEVDSVSERVQRRWSDERTFDVAGIDWFDLCVSVMRTVGMRTSCIPPKFARVRWPFRIATNPCNRSCRWR